VGKLHGFTRRFWQRSPDHRGTPEAPGRVVTLVEEPGSSVLGVVYLVAAEHSLAVLADLDHRERAGYERIDVSVELVDAGFVCVPAVVYLARAGDPGFAPESSNEEIARVVRSATGPSGDNESYVLRLAQALREIGEDDPHVFEIERLLRRKP
jgi:cation transport regulator ChaC